LPFDTRYFHSESKHAVGKAQRAHAELPRPCNVDERDERTTSTTWQQTVFGIATNALKKPIANRLSQAVRDRIRVSVIDTLLQVTVAANPKLSKSPRPDPLFVFSHLTA
jgi:hypothetical protein